MEEAAQKKTGLPITGVLVFGSAGTTLIAVGLALYLGFSSALENTHDLLYRQSEQLIDSLLKDIALELDPVEKMIGWVEGNVAGGDLDPGDADAWQATIESVSAAVPQVVGIGFMTPNLESRIYRPSMKDIVFIDQSTNPAIKKMAAAIKGPMPSQWMAPIWVAGLNAINLAVWRPLFREGKFLGVFVTVIASQSLNRRIGEGIEGSGLTPFVLFDNSWVLLHPKLADWRPERPPPKGMVHFSDKNDVFLPELEDIDDPAIRRIWSAEQAYIDASGGKRLTRVTQQMIGDVRTVYVFRDIARYGARPWTVGAHFDVRVFGAEIHRIRLYGIMGLGILLLAVGIAMLIGRSMARPIQRLARASQLVRAGDLGAVKPLPSSRVRELNDASGSFNEMLAGLKEREKIRGLFGQYVPKKIADQLKKEDGALKPQAAEATVLFVDLAGFTAMAETVTPKKVVEILNDYFSAAVGIIEAHDGVVTQFQGDAILAIFNVPIADPAHALKAVQTARDLQRLVRGKRFGGHELSCRIGVNTGPVIAGNVGARERLNYTVHGDAVNTAARLEQLNKEFGTAVLISGATAARLGGVALKKIGETEIRGKAEKVTVYTFPDR